MARALLTLAAALAAPAVAGLSAADRDPAAEGTAVEFRRDVRPILAERCFACHGPDGEARAADLRLDLAEAVFADRGGYTAVTPGAPDQSELWLRVTAEHEVDRMPPEGEEPLEPGELELLRRWIEEGAAWQEHWAFVTPAAPEAPPVADAGWVRGEVDAFVLAGIEAAGLAPSPEADRATLLRRLALDLTGLPPTLAELDQFLADEREDAYERQVERLLASPRWGERMAVPWMDAARYADTNGYHRDAARTMWLWRDWVIAAFNDNLPYDRFLVEQLAGDLLPEATVDQRIASGFNRNHMLNDEGGAIPEEYQVEYVIDRVRTTSTVFMGLTMSCAQCHDHRYDPVSQEEYYRFYSFFDKLPEKGLDGSDGPAEPKLVVPRAEDEAAIAQAEREIAGLRQRLEQPDPAMDAAEAAWTAAAADGFARWELPELVSAEASGGAVLTELPDRSLLASGENPDEGTYELVLRTEAEQVTALWLEVLRHESFAHGGTGRTTHGNWVLSELEVEAAPLSDPGSWRPVVLAAAVADYSQRKYPVAKAIDGDPGTGWAVDGHVDHSNRNALFLPAEPFGFAGGTQLRVRIRQHYGFEHNIGRVRLSLSSDPALAADAEPAELSSWRTAGPIAGEPDELFRFGTPPEGEQAFEQRPDLVDGVVHTFEGAGTTIYYARSIDAATPRTLSVGLGSDDSVAVWLNGTSLFRNNAKRAPALDQELLDLPLRKGRNELVVQVVNYGGPGGFAFRVLGEGPAVLPGDVSEALRRPRAEWDDQRTAAVRRWFRSTHSEEWNARLGRIEELERQVEEVRSMAPALMVMRDEPGVRLTRILERGRYDRPGEVVTAGTPAFLPPLQPRADGEPDRLDLALWLVDPAHPLTARVAVNRVWQVLFDRGLVSTPEDLGTQSAWPSHPELLDWLAVSFVESGWDVKALVREIVTSSTYRQSSRVTPELLERDPENLLLARAPRFRLPAELLRDQALFAAGLLHEELGGPSARPYQPPGLWAEVSFNNEGRSDSDFYTPDVGAKLYRRSLYTFWKRSLPPPNMQILDAPTREVCTVRRDHTNTPLQALVVMNDPTFVEAARALAQVALEAPGLDAGARVALAFRRATGRSPQPAEVALLVELIAERRAVFESEPEAALALLGVGDSMRAESLDPAEHAAWTVACSLILNLDETLTRS